jgi:hypothetical protein
VIHKFSEADAPDVLTSISAECDREDRDPGVSPGDLMVDILRSLMPQDF